MTFGEASGSGNNVVVYDYGTSDVRNLTPGKLQGLMEIL